MLQFNENNLKLASSPYLQQHKDNPIWWQEWSNEVLAYAKANNKNILVSIGYATCHWCHVMASEAFSDLEVAAYLNEHYVCIKVDKEQRPDIDHFMMSYMQQTQGQGGWPLNVFLSPDAHPFFACTYVPLTPRFGLPPFLQLVQMLRPGNVKPYVLPKHAAQTVEDVQAVVEQLLQSANYGPQFPAYNSLLFLMSVYEQKADERIKEWVTGKLDTMATSGLHDHLQGGFYRYCVDGSWTIPHFEKMLYDQAMHLWVYSVAYVLFKDPLFKQVIEKLLCCLEETFERDGLYVAAHDADTEHEEGKTYVWSLEELKGVLSDQELVQFERVYDLRENFEEGIHLVRKSLGQIELIEKKLLGVRNKRMQPFTDKKVVTSWNALVGIGLLMASRALVDKRLEHKAQGLFAKLEAVVPDGLAHSFIDGKLQSGDFLEDYASVLLFVTYLQETGNYKDQVAPWKEKLLAFFDGGWIESKTDNFKSLPANRFDHPIPSSSALADMALLRANIILGSPYTERAYGQPQICDFYNLMVFMSQGNWHRVVSPAPIATVLVNVLQVRGLRIESCYQGLCKGFVSAKTLLEHLAKKQV